MPQHTSLEQSFTSFLRSASRIHCPIDDCGEAFPDLEGRIKAHLETHHEDLLARNSFPTLLHQIRKGTSVTPQRRAFGKQSAQPGSFEAIPSVVAEAGQPDARPKSSSPPRRSRVRQDPDFRRSPHAGKLWSPDDVPQPPSQKSARRRLQPRHQITSSKSDAAYADSETTKLIKQPETRPISQDQLVAEVKGIYAGLVMVKSKCIEADNAQPSQNAAEKTGPKVSDFSSGLKQYFVEGDVNGTPVEALPDSGADMCFISPELASGLSLGPTPGTHKSIYLANKKRVQSPGMVEVLWKFAEEQEAHVLDCWILPGCVHNLVLGNRFLWTTQTLTKFIRRIKSKLAELPRRLQLSFLGKEKQRLWGSLDGHLTAALPDTGSDIMLISSAYARKVGLTIDRDFKNRLKVEFADGTTSQTSGVVRDVTWNVGGKTVQCDFYVLNDLGVDVILSKNYLFDLNVFSEHRDCFFDTDLEEDLFQLCNIRLIGRYGDTLNVLEEEYLEDGKHPPTRSKALADHRHSDFARCFRPWDDTKGAS
ncbi:hypothetical protein DL769_006307 [Monosporascus sp. CRB-8-3]|nr:hypothetical protein DL769_006307 [Monosporascus sp. CRB-8-3]